MSNMLKMLYCLPCEAEIISILQMDTEYLVQILINLGTLELECELQPVT